MKIIMLERGKGKTTELVKMSAETQTYILTATKQNVRHICQIADDLGLNIPYPITVNEYLDGKLKESFIKSILIDDVDCVLRSIFNTVQIDAITLTKGEKGCIYT